MLAEKNNVLRIKADAFAGWGHPEYTTRRNGMTDVDNTERLVAPGLSTLVFDRLKNVITKVKSNLLNTSVSVVWHVDLESIVDRCAKPIDQIVCHRLVKCKSNLSAGVVPFSNSDLIYPFVIR